MTITIVGANQVGKTMPIKDRGNTEGTIVNRENFRDFVISR